MNKNKISISVLTVALALSSYIPAFALDSNIKASIDGTVNVRSETPSGASTGKAINPKIENQSTTSDNKNGSSSVNSNSGDNSTTSDNRNGSSSDNVKANNENNATTTSSQTANEHRSFVATFVQNLLSVANREGGIGSKVRVIAQEQNDSSSTTAEAVVKVENKGGFSALLFGTDYKNTGVIRSELAKTSDRIDRLSVLASSTSISITDKQQLEAQITALKTDQSKLNTFVNAHEGQFSLFGWFVKLFNK
jgi:hypothetical protein